MSTFDRTSALVGREHDLGAVSQELARFARDVAAPVVGAYQLSCSDESERECVEAFHDAFVHQLLPELSYSTRSSFRTATLGARYERGALAIAEDHYATTPSATAFKLLVVKLNAHVSAVDTDDGPRYGWMQRYDRESAYCGAIHALLAGVELPFAIELRDMFQSGADRLAMLHGMDEHVRCLAAAIVNARLQSDRVLADLASLQPHTPTLFLIVAAVTINRRQPDTELIARMTLVDARADQRVVDDRGLGSDPSRYRLDHDRGRLIVTDPGWPGAARR